MKKLGRKKGSSGKSSSSLGFISARNIIQSFLKTNNGHDLAKFDEGWDGINSTTMCYLGSGIFFPDRLEFATKTGDEDWNKGWSRLMNVRCDDTVKRRKNEDWHLRLFVIQYFKIKYLIKLVVWLGLNSTSKKYAIGKILISVYPILEHEVYLDCRTSQNIILFEDSSRLRNFLADIFLMSI